MAAPLLTADWLDSRRLSWPRPERHVVGPDVLARLSSRASSSARPDGAQLPKALSQGGHLAAVHTETRGLLNCGTGTMILWSQSATRPGVEGQKLTPGQRLPEPWTPTQLARGPVNAKQLRPAHRSLGWDPPFSPASAGLTRTWPRPGQGPAARPPVTGKRASLVLHLCHLRDGSWWPYWAPRSKEGRWPRLALGQERERPGCHLRNAATAAPAFPAWHTTGSVGPAAGWAGSPWGPRGAHGVLGALASRTSD